MEPLTSDTNIRLCIRVADALPGSAIPGSTIGRHRE